MPHVESPEPADSADSAPDGSQPNGSAPNDNPPNEEEEPADPVLPPGADADGPALAVADVSAGEGDVMLRFTVSLSAAAAEQVTVSYATEDGTATAGADYRQTRGSLTFPPESSAARQVEVPIHDDRVAEGAETLILRLHDARGARLAAAAATGTIADDDARSVTVQPAALNVVEGGAATYTVVLGSRPTGTVTVTPAAASPELAVAPRQLSFTAANYHSPQRVTVSAAQDADAVADEPVLIEHTVRGGGYGGAAARPLTATILEDDVSTLAVAAAYAAEHAGRMTFEVSLSLASDGVVTVEFATGAAGDTAAEGQDYAGTSGTLRFPARSTDAQVIEVTVHDDALDEDDREHFTVTLSNPANAELAGGGATVSATGAIEDDDPKPRLSIADATLTEGSGDGAMPLVVRLDPPSARTVAVHYATADATAVAGSDYTPVSGTLTFPAGTTRRTIAVPVADDLLDEEEEHFTVTLSAAVNATMAAAPPLATGTIADDDDAPRLSIADATLTEGSGDAMPFVVRLDPPSGRTVAVHYATADATAVAGSDYTRVGGTLNFPAGTTRRAIAVPVADDLLDEEEEHFTVTLSNPSGAGLADATATGTITDDDSTPGGPDAGPDGGSAPLELDSLRVQGALSAMYPAFAADIYHYALACNYATLRVTARSKRSAAQLTLLRADPSDNHQSTGSLDTLITVSRNDDIAVEPSAADGTVTYVVHCVPHDFPRINILTTSERVTDGLLLINPRRGDGPVEDIFMAVVDNNGVPRFHRRRSGANFRRHSDGRYSITRDEYPVELYDERFDRIEKVTVVAPLTAPDGHDFLITDEGNYLFISYPVDTRNLCEVEGQCDAGETTRMKRVFDSAIQEVTPSGDSVFLWNSWDHVKLEDCRFDKTEYAHLNSLYLKDGDIVASFRYCNQVLRIDRSSGTGAVVWQLGGTAPPRDPDTAFLAIVGDTDGQNEICGQHQATLPDADTVVLFDNGYGCRGPRKDEAPFSRAVEYDISSGTQARFRRQYLLPEGQGYSHWAGGVTVLEENGHWLITWGYLRHATVAEDRRLAVSEVDPESGTVLFEMNMDAPHSTVQVRTYRVYREPETNVPIPLNLP